MYPLPDPEVVRRSFSGPQLEKLKKLLKKGWFVAAMNQFDGRKFMTTLQKGKSRIDFRFEQPWPFSAQSSNLNRFLKKIEKAGL